MLGQFAKKFALPFPAGEEIALIRTLAINYFHAVGNWPQQQLLNPPNKTIKAPKPNHSIRQTHQK